MSTIPNDDRYTIRLLPQAYGVNTTEVSFSDRQRHTSDDGSGSTESVLDVTTYGGWIEKNYFGVTLQYGGVSSAGELQSDVESIHAFSLGAESGTNPLSGSAIWRGLMVGRDGTAPTRPINGQAALTFDFADNTLDVNFTNITGPRTYGSMTWSNVSVQGGLFNDGADSNSLSGSFYGDAHEEVGGVFERDQVIGAFGASRQ